MRVASKVHLARSWRIHELLPDFTLEDVWAQPDLSGTADDFRRAVELVASSDPAHASSLPTRILWQVRDLLGRRLDLGGISGPVGDHTRLPIPGTGQTTLAERLPDDLAGTADDVRFEHLPFVPLYRTDDEFAAEISNRTVHAVMHLGWVPDHLGTHHGQMAVYVKPRGRFGTAYMAFIKPFRHLVVYPAIERQLARSWQD